MFGKTVDLSATKREFLFSTGMTEARFRPVVYLSADKKVLAVGDAPTEGVVDLEARVFEDEGIDDSFAILEAMIRFGLRKILGRVSLGPLTVRISVGADIRQDLKGFAPAVFHYAVTNAGASKVIIA